MLTLEIFTVFDQKANAYLQPFFSPTIETGGRIFDQAINNEGMFNQYAEDYSLFHLGTFDQDECKFTINEPPAHLVNAITLRRTTITPEALSDQKS